MFTVRDVNEAVLIELNKKSAPSFSREEFEYFLNKKALILANEGYEFFAANGRLSDDFRFLKGNENKEVVDFTTINKADGQNEVSFIINGRYFHMLLCEIYLSGTNPSGTQVIKRLPVRRLTDDAEGAAIENVFLKPKYTSPFYDVNSRSNINVDNATVVLKMGILPNGISLHSVNVEYLRLPSVITVTDDDIYGSGIDNSQQLEFPESLRNKYISGVTSLLLEYANNPRLQTLPDISDDIPKIPFELLSGMVNPGAVNTSNKQQ